MKCSTFVEFMIENNKKIHIFSSEEKVIIKTYDNSNIIDVNESDFDNKS